MPTIGHTSGIRLFGSDQKRAEHDAFRRRRSGHAMRGCISQAFDWQHGNQTSCWARSDNGDELLARAVVLRKRRRWQRLIFLCISAARLVWTTSLLTGLTNRRTRNRAGGRRQPNSAYEKRHHHQSRETEPVHSFLNAIAQDTPASHSFRIVSQNPHAFVGIQQSARSAA